MKKKPARADAPERVVVAMSGGVDSSVAAALLKEQGYDVIGVTMKLFEGRDRSGACCSISSAEDARRVAGKLGIPFYVLNFKSVFKKEVIDRFFSEYSLGRTPNPCVVCNEKIKFDALLKKAEELGASFLATGHYARIERSKNGRYLLKRGKDPKKDQSYFLYALGQRALSKTLFPVGGMTKHRVRLLARKFGLKVADKKESQEICFVEGPLSGHFRTVPGDIVDMNGKIIGRHKGYQLYTVGQRRGLGVSAREPMYVKSIEPLSNRVVASVKGDVYGDDLLAGQINLISTGKLVRPLKVKAMIRYRNPGSEARVVPLAGKRVRVEFKRRQFAIAPGQSVVFYRGDTVVGGGIIENNQ